MLARLSAFVVWALVAATAVFWGLRLLARPQPAPAYALTVGEATVARGDLSRLFGAAPVAATASNQPMAPELSSRFKLLGLMAPKPSSVEPAHRVGYALIAVDGKPARPFAVGASLDSGLVLQSVSLRTASIGPVDGAAAVRLEMPALPVAATGTLPPIGMDGTVIPGSVPAAATPPGPGARNMLPVRPSINVPPPSAQVPLPGTPVPPPPGQQGGPQQRIGGSLTQ
jgi:general secretion pathway protein C